MQLEGGGLALNSEDRMGRSLEVKAWDSWMRLL